MRRLLPKQKNIRYSDLITIASLITEQSANIFVFDPEGKVDWDVAEKNATNGETKERILFNLGGALVRYKNFELSELDYIVDFSQKCTIESFTKRHYHSVKAPSGVFRYIYEKGNHSRQFLEFYPVPTFRSKVIKKGIAGILSIGLGGLLGPSFTILSRKAPHYLKILEAVSFDSYSIFLGTPGHWRKPVIQLSKEGEVTHYAKIPITPQTNFLVKQERRNLNRIKALELEQISIPEITQEMSNDGIVMKALHNGSKTQLKTLTSVHINGIKELLEKSIKYEKLSQTSFYTEILDQLHFLRNNPSLATRETLDKLENLHQEIATHSYYSTSIAHGDFAPWNMNISDQRLNLYDWEMAVFGAPLFYDLFHFVYQSEILVKRNNIETLARQINHLKQHKVLGELVNRYNVDLELNHKLYLLHAVSKNLALTARQSEWTPDQSLIMNAWTTMLSGQQMTINEASVRESFLADFQKFMENKRYAMLKFFGYDFKSIGIGSDLDMAVDRAELNAIEAFVKNHPLVRRADMTKKSFMHVAQLHLVDQSFVSIDLIFDFIRKGKRYMDVTPVLDNAELNAGVKFADIWSNIKYIQLFYTLNKSAIPNRYQRVLFSKFYDLEQHKSYLNFLEKTWGLRYEKITESFVYTPQKHKILKSGLGSFGNLRRKLNYLRDVWVDIRKNKGFMVTFSGVDGAGKTTVIGAFKAQFEKQYRKETVVLRHRPGILPILSTLRHGSAEKAEAAASVRMPRTGTNKNPLSSAVRFGYYFLDYIIGQPIVYFKYILRGKIVIYDRYYFDFINDSKRSNIQLNRKVLKRLFAFIYKPDFNFYLYNDPQVILARKQELSAKEIDLLNTRYISLFDELKNRSRGQYHQIKNDSVEETITEIFNTIHKVA